MRGQAVSHLEFMSWRQSLQSLLFMVGGRRRWVAKNRDYL